MSATIKSSQYCHIYVVRHGQSEGNVRHLLQGQKDFLLTSQGKSEATQLANKLKKVHFDAAFSSDLLRAHETAKMLANEHKLTVTTTNLLREQKLGRYEGKKIEQYLFEMKDLLEARQRLATKERFTYKILEDIESDEEMVARFLTFLRETAITYQKKNILVVSHGAMMRILLIHLGYGSYSELAPNAIKNLGYFILDSDGIDFFVRETCGIEKN